MAVALILRQRRAGRPLDDRSFDSRTQDLIRVGTCSAADLVVDDPAACRLHAVIHLDATGATLVDLGTIAGTLVNDVKTRRRRLAAGDLIRIGNTEIEAALTPIVETPIPLPESALAPRDRTIPCRRGVGRDWRALDYVRVEKFDTRHLVADLRRRRHRGWAVVTATVLACVALLAVPMVAPRTAATPAPNGSTAAASPSLRAPKPAGADSRPTAAPPRAMSYQVRPGDTLGSIAADQLGDRRQWRTLFAANRDRLSDPSILTVGTTLVLPSQPPGR